MQSNERLSEVETSRLSDLIDTIWVQVIMPGFCVNGTIGSKVLAGNKKVEIDGQLIDVNLKVEYMSFSAHADAKGIMQLINYCKPKNVLLVHGEAKKMQFLQQKIHEVTKRSYHSHG